MIERSQRKSITPTEAGRLLYAECKEIIEGFCCIVDGGALTANGRMRRLRRVVKRPARFAAGSNPRISSLKSVDRFHP